MLQGCGLDDRRLDRYAVTDANAAATRPWMNAEEGVRLLKRSMDESKRREDPMRISTKWLHAVAALMAVAAVASAQNTPNPNLSSPGGPPVACIESGTLGPDGLWYCFQWGEENPAAPAGAVAIADPVFLTGPYRVEITDCFCTGDVFQVRVDGVVIGTTSPSPVDPDCQRGGGDLDACWADPDYSKGTFQLGPGSHELQIEVVQNPFGSGGAAVRAFAQPAQAIPTLGAWGLAALGLLLAGASFVLLRRRRAA